MKTIFKNILFACCLVAFVPVAGAAQRGTAEEASTLVKQAIAYLKKNGVDKTLAEASNQQGQFVDRDLYLSVYDLNGKVVAHGANKRIIGIDASQVRDADNKYFVREILAKAASAGQGWVDYKWVDPVSKKIEDKSAYFEKSGDLVFAAGYYKN